MTGSTPGGSAALTGRWSYAISARSSAPPEEVWPLLGEAHRWQDWSFLTRSELIQAGQPVADGVGARRRFTSHGIGSTEEVVVWDPPRHLAYSILKGFPVRHYRADVVLEPDGSGTLINWSGTFDTKVPGTGPLLVLILRSMMSRFATAAARYAEQHRSHRG